MGLPAHADGDLYVIQTTTNGRTLAPGAGTAQDPQEAGAWDGPQIVAKRLDTCEAAGSASVTLKTLAKPVEPGGTPVPVLVTYRGSAEPFPSLA